MFEQVLLQGGVAGVVVVAWFFFNKSNMQAFKDILNSQITREQASSELVKKLIETQDKRAEQQYETLREMIDTNQHLIGQMSELKHLVITNQQCPLQRREVRNG